MNDLPENLVSNPKSFANDTSFFQQLSAQKLNEDLNEINHWTFPWKMTFNPDTGKQDQEVIFSRKLEKSVYSPFHFYYIAATHRSIIQASYYFT